MLEKYVFSSIEERQILNFVRQVIANYLDGAPEAILPQIPVLEEKASCFVALYFDGQLRGCIGSIEPFESLADNLRSNAIGAATLDISFAPLELDDLDNCRIEVSIISSLKEIFSLNDFTLGQDGVVIKSGQKSSVFLPQVPLEQHWSKETTLGYLAKKAGLSFDSWKEKDVQIFTFQTKIFGEK